MMNDENYYRIDAETNAQPPYNSGGGFDRNGFSYGVGYQRCICVLIRLIRSRNYHRCR